MNDFLTTLKDLFSSIIKSIPPIHPAGWPFIIAFAIISIVLGTLIAEVLFCIGLILTLWCAYFFRDPKRMVPFREGLVLSPADGMVQTITNVIPPAELRLGDEERTRISIFLNVFNVHVNRIPIAGTITTTHYHPGAFFNASLDKASEENERQLVTVKTDDGTEIGFVQIAGLVARRIICQLSEGQTVVAGERYGLIRFGSRVDIYLPPGIEPLVMEGQTAIGGETILADLNHAEGLRGGTLI